MASRQLPSDYTIRGFRRRLASLDSIPQFAMLGVLSGIVTGLVILAFRTAIEIPLAYLLEDDFENFEVLPVEYLLGLPAAGGVVLALFMILTKEDSRRLGVRHVLERLARHQGHMPWRNALTQFFGGVIALASGQSGGREGPAVHLGAACSSLLGQTMKLPNNSIRILVGCGAAAAISASFNTPIAGVIFSMEVILMEYTIAGFIPVMLAAVTATLINQTVYGTDTAFSVPTVAMNSFYDLPWLVLMGIAIGVLAALFIRLIQYMYRFAPSPVWLRMIIAGLVTGIIAMAVPQILGQGYDTVNQALTGELSIVILAVVCLVKLFVSAVTVAFGVPVGVIGPTLVIGATAGGVLGMIGASAFPETASSPAFYVLMGMGAMMSAALQAPLAALMAVMELTHNTNVVLPAMLVIIVANMTASQLFGMRSIFIMQMETMGLEFRQNPLTMALNRASVASIMNRNFERVEAVIDRERAKEILRQRPTWLLVHRDRQKPGFILRAEDLTAFLDAHPEVEEKIDLGEIPATRKDVSSIILQATLSEALEALNKQSVGALYVNRISAPMIDSVIGIVTREDIEAFYQK